MADRVFRFLGPKVTINVPNQGAPGSKLLPVILPDDFTGSVPEENDDFTLIRYIGNIVFFRADQTGKYKLLDRSASFRPPIKIEAEYTEEDLQKVGGDFNQLKLLLWEDGRWVALTREKHHFNINPPGSGRSASVEIASWAADPTVGWGR